MLLVALESSTRSPSVAVYVDGELHQQALDGSRPHASDLLPCLDSILRSTGHTPRDVTAVAVGIGPGSYTGLRVGIATAQGIARAAGAELIGVPSLEALALGELSPGEVAELVLDARGGGLYHARYERTDVGVLTRVAPRIVPTEELGDLLQDASIALLESSLEGSAPKRDGLRLIFGATPSASSIVELALGQVGAQDSDSRPPVLPLYLRPFEGRVRKR